MTAERAPRRARVAGHPPRGHARAGRAAGHGSPDRRLQRVRSVGRVAPRRAPHPDLRAAPVPAPRRPAGRPRRRRDGHDRRPVRAVDRAQPARPGDARAQRRRRCAASWSGSSTSRRARSGALMVNNLDWLGELSLHRLPARHRQALHDPVHARQGLRPDRAWSGACRSPSSRTCSSSRTTSGTCTGRWASSCRWAAPTSGATSRPASSSSDGRPGWARTPPTSRPTGWPTSSCCRRPGRSSGSPRAATRCGWTPRGRPPSRSTSTGSTPTTATSAPTCAGSRSCRASEIEALDAAVVAAPEAREAQRALAYDITARTHGEDAARAARARLRGDVLAPSRSRDPAVLASIHASTAGFTFTPDQATDVTTLLAATGLVRLQGRGAPVRRGRRADHQRHAHRRSGRRRPGAHRRGVAGGPPRQAPPRDRAPRPGLTAVAGPAALRWTHERPRVADQSLRHAQRLPHRIAPRSMRPACAPPDPDLRLAQRRSPAGARSCAGRNPSRTRG